MKRSEMLKKLANAIAFNRDLGADLIAEGILELVEKNGMKPPVQERCPVLLTQIHTWEPEDAAPTA